MKSISLLSLFLVLGSSLVAAEPTEVVLSEFGAKFPVYDKYQTFTSEMQYSQIKQFFSKYQFASRQQAEAKAAELGLDIFDVLGLLFSGKSSSSSYEEWRQELLKSSYQEALKTGLKVTSVQKINSRMVELIQAQLLRKGLHAYIVPSPDHQNFSFTLDYAPLSTERPFTKGSFTVSPSSVAATSSPKDVIGKELKIGPGGVSVSLRRLPEETVMITYITEDGSGTVRYDAYETPDPVVDFHAVPEQIPPGGTSTLVWTVQNAQSIQLTDVSVGSHGRREVSPSSRTEYALKVVSLKGKTTSHFATVKIESPKLQTVTITAHTWKDDKDDDEEVSFRLLLNGKPINVGTQSNDPEGWFRTGIGNDWDNESKKEFTIAVADGVTEQNVPDIALQVHKHPRGSWNGKGWHVAFSAKGALSNGRPANVIQITDYGWFGEHRDNDPASGRERAVIGRTFNSSGIEVATEYKYK